MQRTKGHPTKRLAAIALMVIASALLVACGSSSSGTTAANTSAASTSPAAPAGTPAGSVPGAGPARGRFAAVRECLKKNGITLPQRVPGKPGQAPPPGGAVPLGGAGGYAGGAQLPKGVTRTQFEAALKKCGGSRLGGLGAQSRLRRPGFQRALASFATCMRQNGIALPAPNTSGSGPIFNTSGLNTNTARFRAAQQKCAPLLTSGARTGGQAPPVG